MPYKDPEARKAYHKAYREANKAKRRAYMEANKVKVAAQKKAYQEDNKEKTNSHTAKRRARKLDQTPDLNIAEKVEIESMYLYNGIFNAVMPEKEWHVDHIVALANGGLHHPSNLQVLTKHDNLSKGARE